jgi:hypothetical protein
MINHLSVRLATLLPPLLSLLLLTAASGGAAAQASGKSGASPKAKGRKPASLPVNAPDVPARRSQPLYCPAPFEAPAQIELSIRCSPQVGLKVDNVDLYYRGGGQVHFSSLSLQRSDGGWYTGVVPASALEGKLLQYYFVASGRDGKEVAANGRPESPNVLLVKGGSVPRPQVAFAQLDEPTSEQAPVEAGEQQEAQAVVPPTASSPRQAGTLWVSWSAGTGYGWHNAGPLETRSEFNALHAFSWAVLGQFSPEVGYQLTPNWAASLQGRHQLIPKKDTDPTRPGSPKQWAHSLLARASYLVDYQRLQLFATGSLGVGSGFRFRIDPQPSKGLESSDTVRGGPGLIGAGAGLLVPFSSRLALVSEANLLFGIGDFAVMLDLGLGLQLGF